MCGRDKGPKGYGQVKGRSKPRGGKRLSAGISKKDIRRLARQGGVKWRISEKLVDATLETEVLKNFIKTVIKQALVYTENAKRNTCTVMDILYALKRLGIPLPHGFG